MRYWGVVSLCDVFIFLHLPCTCIYIRHVHRTCTCVYMGHGQIMIMLLDMQYMHCSPWGGGRRDEAYNMSSKKKKKVYPDETR